jgi:hypothetical protein
MDDQLRETKRAAIHEASKAQGQKYLTQNELIFVFLGNVTVYSPSQCPIALEKPIPTRQNPVSELKIVKRKSFGAPLKHI